MFKTKGFSSNNSLKRRAVIVDAPDLPPEECEFYITNVGIADTDKFNIPDTDSKVNEIQIEQIYEDIDLIKDLTNIPLTQVKGIGKETAVNLKAHGICKINDLISRDPDEIASKIKGLSLKKVIEMQNSAKILL